MKHPSYGSVVRWWVDKSGDKSGGYWWLNRSPPLINAHARSPTFGKIAL